MIRLRWAIGAALTALSVVCATRALSAYVDRGSVVGAAAVAVLAAIALLGFASLLRVRLGLAREAAGLEASAPRGRLWNARAVRLRMLHAEGVVADVDALADRVAAEEAARGYAGRYLVAVAVLVGLVGTFAGLMEALRAISPLLRQGTPVLEALAQPLAGLDVTFGASLVGILVTLALALVHGDVVLAESAVLARLEERTRHELLPILWPAGDSVHERTVRELAELRTELGGFVDGALRAAVAGLGQVTERAAADLSRRVELSLAEAVTAAAAAGQALLREEARALVQAERTVADAGARVTDALGEATLRIAATLEGAQAAIAASAAQARAQVGELQGTFAALAERQHAHAGQILEATATHAREMQAALADAVDRQAGEARDALGTLVATAARGFSDAAERQTSSEERIRTAFHEHAERLQVALAQSTAAACDAMAKLPEAQARELREASQTLLSVANGQMTGLSAVAERQHERAGEILGATAAHAREMQTALADAVARYAGEARDALGTVVETAARSFTDAAERQTSSEERILTSFHEHAELLQASLAQTTAVACEAMAKLPEAQATELREASQALLSAAHGQIAAETEQLAAAAGTLAQAATELQQGAALLAPQVASLAPELGALARELALVGARVETRDEQALVLEEMVRLGEGVDRLHALLELSRGAPDGVSA